MTITIADGRGALWQWDTGRRVRVDDSSVKQVHYQNKCFGRSVDVDVGDDGTAIIPDELLQDWHPLTAYAYVTDDAGGYTKVQVDLVVHKRARPSDYVYTPTEHAGFDRLRAEIGDLGDLTTEDKSTLVAAINEAAASGGGGADWSQNDPDGDGYVKNRPGGYMTDPVITDADAFTITSTEDGDGTYYGAMVAVESSAITLSDYAIGNGVIVDFGGQSYSLTWQLAEGMPACGATVTGETPDWSSAPFCIIAFFEKDRLQGYYIYLQNAVTSPIKVKLKMAKQTPVKIPMKYLESDVYIVKVTSKSNEQRPGLDGAEVSYDAAVSATYDDIVAAINAGKMPILLGGTALSGNPVLRLVDHNTDDVDGSTPYLTFGGTYFWGQNQLHETCVVIHSTGEATCSRYNSSFMNRSKDVDDAMSDTSYNLVPNGVIKKYVDDHVAGGLSLGLTSAAVGQIAKITAVDASGVPTAWAPGDIPVVPTAEISASTAARHSHTNKRVLDGITAAKTAAWDAKAGTAAATQSAAGLMSAADKAKLDGIERGANKTTVPTALKNPNALTIKIGGTTVTYDGSAAKTVTIADGSEVAY